MREQGNRGKGRPSQRRQHIVDATAMRRRGSGREGAGGAADENKTALLLLYIIDWGVRLRVRGAVASNGLSCKGRQTTSKEKTTRRNVQVWLEVGDSVEGRCLWSHQRQGSITDCKGGGNGGSGGG